MLNNMLLGLAPMDGITDCPYRLIVEDVFKHYNTIDTLRYWTEFMSADGYMINPSRLVKHLISTGSETHLIAQIYGGNEHTLLQTAQDIENKYTYFQGIELNIGCPSPKVMQCGAGAGMMKDKKRTLSIIQSLASGCSKPFSIKTRLGLNEQDKKDQYNFIIEASQHCHMITIHARTFQQGHHGEVDRQTLSTLRTDMNPNCILIGNGGISSYHDAKEKYHLIDPDENKKFGIMIGQGAIGNPWIFTNHEPTKNERLQTALDHLYRMAAYEIYLNHAREQFPEISDQLILNRQHLHMIKKYNPDSDEASDIPTIQRHEYLFPMPNRELLQHYEKIIRRNLNIGQTMMDFGDFVRNSNDLRTGMDIRKYIFNYIQGINNNKVIKQQLIQTKKLGEIKNILENAMD